MKPLQLEHSASKFTKNKFPVILVCDGVQSPANIGSLFRISDALGVEKIIFCNADINITSTRLQRTARNTQKTVDYLMSNNSLDILNNLHKKGYKILALEVTENSLPLANYSAQTDDKIALIIGNEQSGVSEEILTSYPNAIHINMHGENSSMNVVQAATIALYNIILKLKQ